MQIVSADKLVREAREGGYAVPAFNTNGGSYTLVRAALEAAGETASPLILQVYEPNCTWRGFDHVTDVVGRLLDETHEKVPVALALDHGKSFESVVRAMKAGFTAVMFDASAEPLETNIRQTREVVRVARAMGVSVEAEVGHVAGNEPDASIPAGCYDPPERPATAPRKTSLEEAMAFVEAVEVDMLAVSIGTAHGVYREQSDIDYDLLTQLHDCIDVPLVQHGTGGIGLDDLARLARGGMSKVNFGEPFRYNYIRYFRELSDSMVHAWHPWKIDREICSRMRGDMVELIQALGSFGKAHTA
ncbi:MAG: class II fructose-bisphosphate aldolase [Planctomycetota bacterium]